MWAGLVFLGSKRNKNAINIKKVDISGHMSQQDLPLLNTWGCVGACLQETLEEKLKSKFS